MAGEQPAQVLRVAVLPHLGGCEGDEGAHVVLGHGAQQRPADQAPLAVAEQMDPPGGVGHDGGCGAPKPLHLQPERPQRLPPVKQVQDGHVGARVALVDEGPQAVECLVHSNS